MKSKTFDDRVAKRNSGLATPSRDQLDERCHKKMVKSFSDTYDLAKRYTSEAINTLVDIHKLKWWRKTHTTFEDFCVSELGISATHFRRLKEREEVIESLPEKLRGEITNERQARVLSKVPPLERPALMERAKTSATNGHVTAANLEAARQTKTHPLGASPVSAGTSPNGGRKEKIVVLDENGIPIPDDALPFWEKAWGEEHKNDPKVQDILTEISRLKSVVVGGRERGEFRWLKVTNSIADTFGSLFSLISEAKPYAVCTTCMGSPSLQIEGCNFCKNTGLISKWQWDTQSRKEVKDMMIRRAADLKKEREAESVH